MTSAHTRRLRCQHDRLLEDQPPAVQWPTSPSIVDGVLDLLELLPVYRRWGLIADLSSRYYDGWRPGRAEIADLVAVEVGVLSPDTYCERAFRRRAAPNSVPDITPLLLNTRQHTATARYPTTPLPTEHHWRRTT